MTGQLRARIAALGAAAITLTLLLAILAIGGLALFLSVLGHLRDALLAGAVEEGDVF